MMTRIPLLLALFLSTSVVLQADVSILWSSVDEGNGNTDFVKKADGTTNADADWIAQLIWSPVATTSAVDPGTPFVPTGAGEQVLVQKPLNDGSPALDGLIEPASFNQAGPALAGGFVYSRVFNVNSIALTPTLYGENTNLGQPPGGLSDQTFPFVIPQFIVPKGIVVNQVIIPEPSTYAMLGCGLFILGWFHRRKKA